MLLISNLWEALGGKDDSYTFRMIAMPYIPVAGSRVLRQSKRQADYLREYCMEHGGANYKAMQ